MAINESTSEINAKLHVSCTFYRLRIKFVLKKADMDGIENENPNFKKRKEKVSK